MPRNTPGRNTKQAVAQSKVIRIICIVCRTSQVPIAPVKVHCHRFMVGSQVGLDIAARRSGSGSTSVWDYLLLRRQWPRLFYSCCPSRRHDQHRFQLSPKRRQPVRVLLLFRASSCRRCCDEQECRIRPVTLLSKRCRSLGSISEGCGRVIPSGFFIAATLCFGWSISRATSGCIGLTLIRPA